MAKTQRSDERGDGDDDDDDDEGDPDDNTESFEFRAGLSPHQCMSKVRLYERLSC